MSDGSTMLERDWTRDELSAVSVDVLVEIVLELQRARLLDREYMRDAVTFIGRMQLQLAAVERERETALRELGRLHGGLRDGCDGGV